MLYVFPAILFFGLPIFMLLSFKANVGIMFLAACTGLVLLSNLDPVVVSTAGAVVPGEGEAYVRLAVVLLAMVFAGLMFKNNVKASHTVLHLLIIILLGLTLWLTLPEVTGVSWLLESTEQELWQTFNDFKSLIIALGFGLSLLAVFISRKQHHSRHKKH